MYHTRPPAGGQERRGKERLAPMPISSMPWECGKDRPRRCLPAQIAEMGGGRWSRRRPHADNKDRDRKMEPRLAGQANPISYGGIFRQALKPHTHC